MQDIFQNLNSNAVSFLRLTSGESKVYFFDKFQFYSSLLLRKKDEFFWNFKNNFQFLGIFLSFIKSDRNISNSKYSLSDVCFKMQNV